MNEDILTQILNRVNAELSGILPDLNIDSSVKDELTNAQRAIQKKVQAYTERMTKTAEDFINELNRDAEQLTKKISDARERARTNS